MQDEEWSTGQKLAIIGGGTVVIVLIIVNILLPIFFLLNLGDTSGPHPPNTDFNYTYDEADRTVTIQHVGGDWMEAQHVYIRGDDIVGACAQWHELDSHTGPNEDVSFGDNITLEVTSDRYLIQLVWNSSYESERFLISEATGPNRKEATPSDVSEPCEDTDSGSEFDIGPGLALVFGGIGGVALTLGGRVLRRRL